MFLKQISVFLENRPGALLEMVRVLGEQKINMRAFSLAETSEFGIARIIVEEVDRASAALKQAGYVNSVTPVLAVEIPDAPGGLEQTLEALNAEKVNVEYMYAFVGPQQKFAYMIFRVTDNEKAAMALERCGIRLVDMEALELD